jgi:hypothetical protein
MPERVRRSILRINADTCQEKTQRLCVVVGSGPLHDDGALFDAATPGADLWCQDMPRRLGKRQQDRL